MRRFLLATLFLIAAPGAVWAADLERGKYLLHAGNCISCHTDLKNKGPLLAGGRALKTPFGTFYGPNITPDKETGIGAWSDADFVRALRQGVSPKGEHYFPVFPYTSFTRITDADLLDLKAYLFSLAPVKRANTPHDVAFPFGYRFPLFGWKLLNFRQGPDAADADRGSYLANALGHCAECHTQRNIMGALKRPMWMAGSQDGAEGKPAPNITPDKDTGIGEWSVRDLTYFLETGTTREGDVVGGLMAEVVEHGTGHLNEADRQAMTAYLRALPPIANKIKRK